jgi:hypothetical protein
MSRSSYAVLKGFEFFGLVGLGIWLAPFRVCRDRNTQYANAAVLGWTLFFELIELIKRNDLTSGRAYPHVQIALLHELACLFHGRTRREAAKIYPTGSIVPADQVLQLGCVIHAATRSQ